MWPPESECAAFSRRTLNRGTGFKFSIGVLPRNILAKSVRRPSFDKARGASEQVTKDSEAAVDQSVSRCFMGQILVTPRSTTSMILLLTLFEIRTFLWFEKSTAPLV
jgi:hypothetical protein